MSKSALELIPAQLQGVELGDADVARALAMAKPTNDKLREAADAHMRFEDEPARFIAFMHDQAARK